MNPVPIVLERVAACAAYAGIVDILLLLFVLSDVEGWTLHWLLRWEE